MKTLIIRPKPRTRRRPLVLASTCSLALLISVSSASAQLGLNKVSGLINKASVVTSTIEPVLGAEGNEVQSTLTEASSQVYQAQQYLDQLSGFYSNIVGGNLSGILGDIQEISGALGIPDPFAIRSQSEWDEQIPNGTFSTVQAKGNIVDRAIVGGIASTVLGKDGQSVTREQQQQLANVVQSSATAAQQSAMAAQQAQTRNITQDILKDVAVQQAVIAEQQTAQAQISQQMSGQLTGLQLQGAASNVMLSDISGSLDFQQLQRQMVRQTDNFSEAQTAAQVFIPGIRFSD